MTPVGRMRSREFAVELFDDGEARQTRSIGTRRQREEGKLTSKLGVVMRTTLGRNVPKII